MHDPMPVAFEIKRPWPVRTSPRLARGLGRWYWPTWVTIWHVDPERDGTDDSCGWFTRARHGDPAVLQKIAREFSFHWDRDRTCWFHPATGRPQCSTLSIALLMFRVAARVLYEDRLFDRHGWRGSERFMRRHLYEVLAFAENTVDSFRPFIEQVYGPSTDPREQRIHEAAAVVYGALLRWTQPWYRHARWHVWHWSIQVHPLQALKRWVFSRCAGCGRRFRFGEAPVAGGWGGHGPRWFRGEPGVYHGACFPQPPMAASPAAPAPAATPIH